MAQVSTIPALTVRPLPHSTTLRRAHSRAMRRAMMRSRQLSLTWKSASSMKAYAVLLPCACACTDACQHTVHAGLPHWTLPHVGSLRPASDWQARQGQMGLICKAGLKMEKQLTPMILRSSCIMGMQWCITEGMLQ